SQSADISCELQNGALHAETDTKIRRLVLARVLNGSNHSRNAALAESAGNQDRVIHGQSGRRVLIGLQALGLDPLNLGFQIMSEAAVNQCLAQTFVGVLKADILADD